MRAAAALDAARRLELEEQLAELRRSVVTQIRQNRATTAELAYQRSEAAAAREELARLRPEVELWRSVQASRSYRIARAYIRANSLPVVGPALRLLRQPVGTLWRALRRRS